MTVGAAISRPRDGSAPAYTLSETGKIVETAIQSIPTVYPSVSVEKYFYAQSHSHDPVDPRRGWRADDIRPYDQHGRRADETMGGYQPDMISEM